MRQVLANSITRIELDEYQRQNSLTFICSILIPIARLLSELSIQLVLL